MEPEPDLESIRSYSLKFKLFLKIKNEQLDEIKKFLHENGETSININYSNDGETHYFKLKKPR